MTLWLIGMMGSGKSAAGRLAAGALGVDFADTDEEIASRMGCSVAQLWGNLGESAFREMEKAALSRLSGAKAVVATGGGVVMDPANRALMRESGTVIWLTASPATLASRVGAGDTRPLLAGAAPVEESLDAILRERTKAYASASHSQIDTEGRTVEQVAEEIAALWPG